MGHLIAKEFMAKKTRVTLLERPVTHARKNKSVNVIKYNYFDELKINLRAHASRKYDIIIHAAAVSDFKVAKAFKGKVNSTGTLSLKLIPNEKIIDGYQN